MHSDKRTMEFLSERTTLIIVSCEGRPKARQSDIPSKNVTILGCGTGVFIEKSGRFYVATNEHVIRAHHLRSEPGTRVHIALGALQSNAQMAESHDGYAVAAREFVEDASGYAKLDAKGHPIPRDLLNDTDLALVRLSDRSAKAARKAGRKFVQWDDVATQSVAARTPVCFRGFPRESVDYIRDFEQFVVDGFSLFTHVIRVEGSRIVVDATEQAVCFGNGGVQPNRDLHGISGSGLFGMTGQLVGLVCRGDPSVKEIFACPAHMLGPLFDKVERSLPR